MAVDAPVIVLLTPEIDVVIGAVVVISRGVVITGAVAVGELVILSLTPEDNTAAVAAATNASWTEFELLLTAD